MPYKGKPAETNIAFFFVQKKGGVKPTLNIFFWHSADIKLTKKDFLRAELCSFLGTLFIVSTYLILFCRFLSLFKKSVKPKLVRGGKAF